MMRPRSFFTALRISLVLGMAGAVCFADAGIDAEFQRNIGKMYRLYTQALGQYPELNGRVDFRFTVLPSGQPMSCKIMFSELNVVPLENRLCASIMSLRFPLREETVIVQKSVTFEPHGGLPRTN